MANCRDCEKFSEDGYLIGSFSLDVSCAAYKIKDCENIGIGLRPKNDSQYTHYWESNYFSRPFVSMSMNDPYHRGVVCNDCFTKNYCEGTSKFVPRK